MIQITPQMRILLAVEPVAGALVVFRSRRGRALKLLCYDGYGNTEIMGHGRRQRGCFRGKAAFWRRMVFP